MTVLYVLPQSLVTDDDYFSETGSGSPTACLWLASCSWNV